MKILILGPAARYGRYRPPMEFIDRQELVFLDKESTEAQIIAAGRRGGGPVRGRHHAGVRSPDGGASPAAHDPLGGRGLRPDRSLRRPGTGHLCLQQQGVQRRRRGGAGDHADADGPAPCPGGGPGGAGRLPDGDEGTVHGGGHHRALRLQGGTGGPGGHRTGCGGAAAPLRLRAVLLFKAPPLSRGGAAPGRDVSAAGGAGGDVRHRQPPLRRHRRDPAHGGRCLPGADEAHGYPHQHRPGRPGGQCCPPPGTDRGAHRRRRS